MEPQGEMEGRVVAAVRAAGAGTGGAEAGMCRLRSVKEYMSATQPARLCCTAMVDNCSVPTSFKAGSWHLLTRHDADVWQQLAARAIVPTPHLQVGNSYH